MPYDNDHIARLLRLLRSAPEAWVARAHGIPADLRGEQALTDRDLAELGRKLEVDATFRHAFDLDPVAAAEEAGMRGLASRLRYELGELVALAERFARDDAYRRTLTADPIETLAMAGLPAAAAEPLLEAFAVPDEVLERLPEVVAHVRKPLSPAARVLVLLLGSTAVATELRSAARRARSS